MIQVGQVLDKYELLERVGQGGMAVVYRGLDRTLKRTVAVKILHKHLSDYQEARDRFEREAQAVAKLRHENILEIFDYAAKADDCYIVTEFIDGQTLKQVTTDRPIQFPEIGAMVLLQVCRALAHAHAGGILHRDVKPENIMIRSDGVVKLMDFGISHMVDLERLTVTGQLLGSPAYMAPEHVEGRPIDYRTDVFAAGIVLYQLTVGKLPFEGKNPHEVLKRIAECRFIDPRQANPRIGNRLGRIILRAMAAEPANRYPAISEMVIALETYLEDSGIGRDKVASELARYFQAPASYEQTLAVRLVDHLTRRGGELLDADDRAGALDAFDRVLTIEPANEKVIAILDKLNRRTRFQHIALAVAGVAVVAGSAYAVHVKMQPAEPDPPADVTLHGPDDHGKPVTTTAHEVKPVAADAAPATTMASGSAATVVVTPHVDGGALVVDDAPPVAVIPVTIEVKTYPGAQYRLDKGPWLPVQGDTFSVNVLDHPIVVDVKNDCCGEQPLTLTRDGDKLFTVRPPFLAASITPRCDVAGAAATIDGKPARLGESFTVVFGKNATSSTKAVPVVFSDGKTNDPQTITVTAGKEQGVKCALH